MVSGFVGRLPADFRLKSKGQSGKPLCTNPPYGYIKDPEDKMHWIVDEDAAKVVKEAFRLCMQGYGPTQIAKEFSERRIMNPTAHAKASGINIPDNRGHDDDYTHIPQCVMKGDD